MKAFRMGAWLLMFILICGSSARGSDKDQSLFVNLISNEMNRAAMAINFSTRICTQKKIPVTIFLNVDGVRLVNRHIPGNTHVSGKSLQEMLADFMAAAAS